ncbi:hypothetical protein [Leptotrichia massiliensis]|uniref:hypothetical protein n=1 Tax=Leptotrichia massiliensis TaxID=1852388 RepID=UPI0028D7ACD4|nr:hypothetical protein [Leptotrichia massiliensis]
MFFLLIGIIIPSVVAIRNESKKEEASKLYNWKLSTELSKGTVFQQKIYIPGYITRYGVLFTTYGRNNKGKIKIELSQGSKKKVEIVDMSKIKDNDFHFFNFKFFQFKKGEAVLRIEGIDGETGNSVSMHETEDIMYGELLQNGEKTEKSLVQRIEFYEVNTIVTGQIIFLFLAISSYFYFLKLIKKQKKNNIKIYIVTALIAFFLINIKAPVLSFKAEPYAEEFYDFFYYARKGITGNIFRMEGGYFPLFHRLIAILIAKLGFNARWTIFLMSNVAILIISFGSSIFTLHRFKKYGNIFFRFTISILFAVFNIFPYAETHTFIAFAYMNIIMIFYISLIDFNKLKKKNYILLMILTVLLCISKLHYITLLPVATGILILLWKKLKVRDKIFLASIALSTMIQLVYTYRHTKNWIRFDNEPAYRIVGRHTTVWFRPIGKIKILEIINIGTHQIVQQFINIFNFGTDQNQNILNLNMVYLIIFIIIAGVLVYISIKNKNRESIILLSLLSLIFINSYLNVISKVWSGSNLWSTAFGAINTRHALLTRIPMLLILVLIPFIVKRNMGERKNNIKILYNILIIFIILRYSPLINNNVFRYDEVHSDWKKYSKFYKAKSWTLPIYPFFIMENQKGYYIGKETGKIEYTYFLGEKYYLDYLNSKEEIMEMVLPKPLKLEYLYTKRVRNYNFDRVKLIGYDIQGNKVFELLQLNDKERSYIGFKNDNPDKEISKIQFVNENNKKAYVVPEIVIGTP